MWSEWLLHRRHGGDPAHEPVVRDAVRVIRDRVLAGAELRPGMTLLDVGTGDGLIAFGAFDRVGLPFTAILADISVPLLRHAERLAISLGLRDHCNFLEASAESLVGVANSSMDVVTSRAVLAYVRDRPSSVRRFFEVLRPGGRVSIAEPINQDEAVQLTALTNLLPSSAATPLGEWTALLQRCRSLQMPSTLEAIGLNPLTSFTERTLVQLFQNAGFASIHMELHIDIRKPRPMAWGTFIDIAPLPGVPTLREIFAAHLSPAEQALFEAGLRPVIESGDYTARDAIAYLTAQKP